MNRDIPLEYFGVADKCVTECTEPIADTECILPARYFQLLLTHLIGNEEISEEARHEMAAGARTNSVRVDEIAEFLNQWDNE